MIGELRNGKGNLASKLGETIKILRTRNNLRQDELAERAGINRSYLSMLENGKSSPTLDVLDKLAQALNIRMSDLISGEVVEEDKHQGEATQDGIVSDIELEEKHFEYDTEIEFDVYPGLKDFLSDQDEMMLAQPKGEEILLLKGIRFHGNFRPDKRFYRDALLSYRRSRRSSS